MHFMKKKVTLTLKKDNARFLKKHAKEKKTTMSGIVDDYFELLKRLDKKGSSFI